jgi:hypothetical protein
LLRGAPVPKGLVHAKQVFSLPRYLHLHSLVNLSSVPLSHCQGAGWSDSVFLALGMHLTEVFAETISPIGQRVRNRYYGG